MPANRPTRRSFLASLGVLVQDPIFSADVKVVSVFASVRSNDGQIVKDLTKEDFRLLEDGRPQTIRYFSQQSDLPVTLGLLVDTSGSERRMIPAERAASRKFLRQVLQPGRDKAFLIRFDREVELLQDVTSSPERLENALELLKAAPLRTNGGEGPTQAGTAFYDGIYFAASEILSRQTGRKALILLTDGEDNGSAISLDEALASVERADSLGYAVRIADEEIGGMVRGWNGAPGMTERPDGKKILKRIAKQTGGVYFAYGGKKSLADIYSEIEEDLRNQYSIGYTSDRADGHKGYRKIGLTLRRKGLAVRARAGYYA